MNDPFTEETARPSIWTLGHSTHSLEAFVAILQSFQIQLLVDIRSFPGSKHFPHFHKQTLEASLPERGIEYLHLRELGGRRQPRKDSINDAWRVTAFRGYADYMETWNFQQAAAELERWARKRRTAYMCAEAVWWSCHRALVSDWLKSRGWAVWHILGEGKAQEHPYTKPARLIDGNLSYRQASLPGLADAK